VIDLVNAIIHRVLHLVRLDIDHAHTLTLAVLDFFVLLGEIAGNAAAAAQAVRAAFER